MYALNSCSGLRFARFSVTGRDDVVAHAGLAATALRPTATARAKRAAVNCILELAGEVIENCGVKDARIDQVDFYQQRVGDSYTI